uniref:Peptidase S1 domain-containing protein n=1 Tax=Anopheles merus TaxID=30066 RepID=A0A182VAE8_ANOME
MTPFVRNPKIMHGTPTVEGQYPWQVSLELLHPSYGFIGHWCGGVLIDRVKKHMEILSNYIVVIFALGT